MITVSIVAGRNPANLARCLESLKTSSYLALNITIIDNLFGYDVLPIINKHYPHTHLIKNAKIKGFAKNHNQILKNSTTKYTLVLNDDIILDEKCISNMHQFMESHQNVGVVGPALHEDSWSKPPQTAGGLTHSFIPINLKVLIITLIKLLGLYQLVQRYVGHKETETDKPLELSFVSGACMLARREALESAGLFDERFYMYFDDVDLGERMRKKGWRCYQVPDAKVIHSEFGSSSARTYIYIARSAQYYAKKYNGFIIRILVFLLAVILRSLALFKSSAGTTTTSTKPSNPRNILIMKVGGVGDALLIMPALKALKDRFPKSRLVLLTEDPCAKLISGAPYIDELHTFTEFYTLYSFTKLFKMNFLSDGYNLIRFLTKRRFDIFIEFQHLYRWRSILKPLLIGYLSRARLRLGLDYAGRGFFLTHKIKDIPNGFKHHIQRYLEIVQLLGAKPPLPNDFLPKIFISPDDTQFAHDFILRTANPYHTPEISLSKPVKKEVLLDSNLLIGIHPGGNSRHLIRRTWEPERFIEVANQLTAKHNARIMLTEGPSESALVNYIKERLIKPPVICKNVTLKQLSAIISHCRIFISNDTGPMHIAVAMRVPTIGLFGPGNWTAYGSYPSFANFVMMRKPIDNLACRKDKTADSLCWDMNCTSRECLNLITADEVIKTAEKLLNKIQ